VTEMLSSYCTLSAPGEVIPLLAFQWVVQCGDGSTGLRLFLGCLPFIGVGSTLHLMYYTLDAAPGERAAPRVPCDGGGAT
jgi:hypothetical protein